MPPSVASSVSVADTYRHHVHTPHGTPVAPLKCGTAEMCLKPRLLRRHKGPYPARRTAGSTPRTHAAARHCAASGCRLQNTEPLQHVGHIYAQTTIDEATPGHMLARWAPPSTSNWSANAVGQLKRLPPPLLIEQDGFLVSRGFNGGLRPSSSALWCDRFFEHACYGKVGQHVHIITNDTKYRKNSTWKVYDWFGRTALGRCATKFPRAGFAT